MNKVWQVSVLVCLLFVAISSGSSLASGASTPTAPTVVAAADDDSAAVFTSKCAACHGADGKGSPVGKSLKAPELPSKEVQAETDDTIKHVIVAGKGNMPPFGQTLTDVQVDSLVKYVRTFAGK